MTASFFLLLYHHTSLSPFSLSLLLPHLPTTTQAIDFLLANDELSGILVACLKCAEE